MLLLLLLLVVWLWLWLSPPLLRSKSSRRAARDLGMAD